MFNKSDKDKIHADLTAVAERLDRVGDLLEGESVAADLRKITRELADKQLQWDREKREVEHMVGLQKKRAEQERELAVKEAKLAVREGNLSAKESAFEERLEKVTEQLKDQIDYLRGDIIKAILDRLPTFNVETALEPHRLLGSGNGRGGDDN